MRGGWEMLRKSILVFLAALQSACIGGFGVFKTERGSYHPLGSKAEKQGVRLCSSTKADVVRLMGKPKREYTETSKDFLVYNLDVAWRGVVPWIIIPIPLIVPVGMNEISFEFENDRLLRFWREAGDVRGGLVFWFPFLPPVWAVDGRDLMKPTPLLAGPEEEETPTTYVRLRVPILCPGESGINPARIEDPTDDYVVNCVAGGERRWTNLSKCDPQ
jgi:hypothetical protein